MTESFCPETSDQAVQFVAWAAAEQVPIEVCGRGSKRALGRPVQASYTLDLSGLSGITMYEPEELVLAAGTGTPLAEIDAALREYNQALAFEPPDLGPLLGSAADAGTLGGAIACNLAGPRRIASGAARDHFLGFHGVSGRGEAFKSGGRTVKNVTGYDLCKLMAGSYGTLAAMTDMTMKIMPAAEATRTVALAGLDTAAAVRALTRGLQSAYAVSGAAYLPADVAASSEVDSVRAAGTGLALLRVEGPPASVVHRAGKIADALRDMAAPEIIEDSASLALWREIRDVAPFVGETGRAVWRLSVPPADGPATAERIAAAVADARFFMDWGGGLLWVSVPEGTDACHAAVRGALPAAGGHATLIRAGGGVRAHVPVFQPAEPGVAALTRRLKANFDPHGILNPGRMEGGA